MMSIYKVGMMSSVHWVQAPSSLSAACFYNIKTGAQMPVIYEEDGKKYEGDQTVLDWAVNNLVPTPEQHEQLAKELPQCRFVPEGYQPQPNDDLKESLTLEQAIALLPDGDIIKCARNPGGSVVVAPWNRDTLIATMHRHPIEKSGPVATSQGYGMTLQDDKGYLFIQAKQEAS